MVQVYNRSHGGNNQEITFPDESGAELIFFRTVPFKGDVRLSILCPEKLTGHTGLLGRYMKVFQGKITISIVFLLDDA